MVLAPRQPARASSLIPLLGRLCHALLWSQEPHCQIWKPHAICSQLPHTRCLLPRKQ